MALHNIKFDEDTEQFFKDYKESHGVSKQAFVELAVREKIINVKAELKLREYVNSK